MKKSVLAFIIAVIMLFTAMPVAAQGENLKAKDEDQIPEDAYNDITGGWYKDPVLKYGYAEIFSKGDNKFYPDMGITRMEFVRMLHKVLGININYFAATDIKDFYNDVKNEDIGSGNLYDLVTTGIIDRKDSFGPDLQLDRDEMIHYIINALKYVTGGEYALIQIMPEPFKDDDKINPEYKNDVNESVILKLIFGRENNMLYPKQGATRAEAAAVISRLVDLTKTLKTDVAVKASANEVNGGLKISIVIENNTGKDITINHSSGQKYDFAFLDSKGDTLYQWSADKSFVLLLSTTIIKAGEKVEFTDEINSDIYEQIKDSVDSIKAYIVGTSQDFNINAGGYEVIQTLKTDVAVKASANEVNGGLKMSLTIENNTGKAVTINHTSGQKYDFVLLDSEGEILYQWSANKKFIMALTKTVIGTSEKDEFTDELDSDAYGRIKDSVDSIKAYIVGTSQDFNINAGGYAVLNIESITNNF